ncbi:MAG: hypothetical protein ACTHMZ_00395 [Actinomycetes bacterium]
MSITERLDAGAPATPTGARSDTRSDLRPDLRPDLRRKPPRVAGHRRSAARTERVSQLEVPQPGAPQIETPQPEAPHAELPPAGARLRERSTWRPRPAVLVLVTVLALAALAAGALGWAAHLASADRAAGPAALAAARSAAPVVLSYDSAHLDGDFAKARRLLTGSFAADYTATTTKVVAPAAEQYHAKVTADVAAASVVRASREEVVVLLFVNQTTTSDRLDGPKVDLNRVRMTMVPVHGRWLVARVDAL